MVDLREPKTDRLEAPALLFQVTPVEPRTEGGSGAPIVWLIIEMTSGPGLESREAVVVNISTSVEENTAIEPLNDCNIASDSFRVDFN